MDILLQSVVGDGVTSMLELIAIAIMIVLPIITLSICYHYRFDCIQSQKISPLLAVIAIV